ncbi:LSU ribosomal protein L4P [Algoriphagus ornithinivorans]|jgi:large subunit ribosomal protein L4|uniref:Large ribosomal subunit protein uL4 n=1 Tax=Algoriphagus ornithinivorans TaxID=226506 RepID=A0A1I5FAP9_9BACT|nr:MULTISPECIES: 50S ribosomal protein L4 [Algoriphagus]MAL15023.1 50S ribosomal protein L4 [Algoriphagus sp.]QYH39881.1 50S ribosomal protein L4 [Algoriphagus sp. NBT04N3]SFO20733.1 LSU ribosomal protein L4P [Algoriphagus ornithinivorans]HAD51133.1 50S ribosomal protein L4 [Algoriphagus sp.]HAH36252.1 50S ribosomal protein L4 [Algoriphagus sp.]|tara:strand:+ start:208 stop:837 length:630 start_codon:yes stop_codon:yes gene_type:complete
MELAVINQKGEDTGRKVQLSDEIFAIEPNDNAIYLDVKQYLANQRQGTHKSKERNEVAGSTKKIKKQKGTGGARAGSLKSPLFRGGGRVFGPKPRDYSFKLNKKVKQLARKSALSYKVKDNSLSVLENISFDAPKTKNYLALLNGLALSDKKTLLVLPEDNKNVYLSSRNLPKAKVVTVNDVNTYQLLNADHLVICEDSVSKLETILSK